MWASSVQGISKHFLVSSLKSNKCITKRCTGQAGERGVISSSQFRARFDKRIFKLNYRKRLVEALDRTEKLGLKLDFSPLPLKADLPIDVKQNILQLCAEAFNHYGYLTSSDLASKCTPVHLMLQSHLKSDLNIDSYITIGDRYWDDYIYCEMSDESINKELESPNYRCR